MDCYKNHAALCGDCSRNRYPQGYRQGVRSNQPAPSRSGCCDCNSRTQCLTDYMTATEQMPLGMCYIPYQEFSGLYEWDTGFCQGTLFSALDKPFLITNCPQGGIRR